MMVEAAGSVGGESLEHFIREAPAQPPPHREEERLHGTDAHSEGAARERLVRAHLRTVVDEAVAHRGFGVSTPDLIGVGLRALMQCAEEYDARLHGSCHRPVHEGIRTEIRRALFGQRTT